MSLFWKILVFDEGTESVDIATNENILLLRFADWTMGFTYDFYANRWRMCSISYYFRNSSASINNVTNVNYDIDLQKMYMYSCVLCLIKYIEYYA
jgi:hypothetical protein